MSLAQSDSDVLNIAQAPRMRYLSSIARLVLESHLQGNRELSWLVAGNPPAFRLLQNRGQKMKDSGADGFIFLPTILLPPQMHHGLPHRRQL